MADSDNSRTLSTVTRGTFHSLVAAPLPTYHAHSDPEIPLFEGFDGDPAVALWCRWRIAWNRLNETTLRQQQLETSLFSGDLPSSGEQDGSRAYNQALEAEDRAALAEELAAQTLWQAPAVSIAGVIAQLDAILHRGQPSPATSDEPWPQLRGVMADLLRIDTALDPLPRLEGQPALQED